MDLFLLSRGLMKNLGSVLLAMLLMPAACIQIPDIEAPPDEPDCSAVGEEPIGIQWVSPMEGAQVGSSARLQVHLTGDTPEAVDLLVDGTAVATLKEPFVLDWETQSVSEGPHAFVVRARRCGQESLSTQRQLVVDRTKPSLIAQTPQDGAQWVSVHQTVRAELSEPVVAGSVNNSTVRLLAGQREVSAEVSLSQDGRVLTLQPLEPLPVSEVMRVVFDPSVADTAGNPVSMPSQGWSWRVPAFLPLGNSQTLWPRVDFFSFQVDRGGTPLVARLGTETSGVQVERWNGGAWQSLGAPLQGSTGDPQATECVLHLDPSDTPHVAWVQPKLDGSVEIHVRRWSGSAWTALGAPVIPILTQASVTDLRMKVESYGGVPVIAFKERNASELRVTVFRFQAGEWRSNVGSGAQSVPNLTSLHLELNQLNEQILGWSRTEYGFPGWAIYIVRKAGGSELGYVPSRHAESPMMAMTVGGDNRIVVASPVQSNGSQSVLVQEVLFGAGTWERVGDTYDRVTGRTDASTTALKFDAQGRLIMLLEEPESEASSSVRSLFIQRWNTDHWEPLGGALSANPGATPVSQSQLGTDKNGRIFLAWSEADEQDATQSRLHVFRPND
ncbi:Ig-like domain-containing protein [Corallococcus sp. AS-1-12]|uniref:Ig-like domain-containing protein n=1 Tax=Corallococcus sp. AS-1-12 TaxID=2874598 RepID=UPI001CBED95D|nr:Ig-like domain-containing protein [Corallococcus sp. AS-1-12]MBZ4330834.1 Ig-like domain-containing protein [Corallococcus sp. AS-1-12]